MSPVSQVVYLDRFEVDQIFKGDPRKLLWPGLMTVLFSAVLNNVTAMIIVGSLTVVSLERLGRRELLLGFLLIEGLLTNVGGLLTLISSVPNIIVGTAANISFVTFVVAAPCGGRSRDHDLHRVAAVQDQCAVHARRA